MRVFDDREPLIVELLRHLRIREPIAFELLTLLREAIVDIVATRSDLALTPTATECGKLALLLNLQRFEIGLRGVRRLLVRTRYRATVRLVRRSQHVDVSNLLLADLRLARSVFVDALLILDQLRLRLRFDALAVLGLCRCVGFELRTLANANVLLLDCRSLTFKRFQLRGRALLDELDAFVRVRLFVNETRRTLRFQLRLI